jgi:hypothetical protein
MKLNLASGTDIRDGWINMDIVPRWPLARRRCDIIWDARQDKIPFMDNTVEEIYAGYLLLHLAPKYHKSVLAEMYRVLAPTGTLVVHEVDMDIVMRRYLENPLDESCNQLIWGEQGIIHGDSLADYDKHCQGFTEMSLNHTLNQAGFKCQRIKIHHESVWYELTMRCQKVIR